MKIPMDMLAEPIPYLEIPGVISRRSLEEHYKLYTGYVEALNQVDHCDSNDAYAKEIERESLSGAILHEQFFSILTPNPTPVEVGNLAILLVREQWASLEHWWASMKTVAMESTGWACFVKDWKNRTRILSLDEHDQGIFGHTIICAIDCYEHAYWTDFGSDKSSYIDALFPVLNWHKMESYV